MLSKEKQVFQAFTPFGSQIQTDCPLFCARFTGLETRRAEWCKPLWRPPCSGKKGAWSRG